MSDNQEATLTELRNMIRERVIHEFKTHDRWDYARRCGQKLDEKFIENQTNWHMKKIFVKLMNEYW